MGDLIIKDDTYMEIDNEFDQIRTALGMYISKTGTEGAFHIIKEGVNNSIDECVNPEALGKKIEIFFNEVTQTVTISDFSRGIPFDKMVDVSSKKHTSTKFIREGEKMKDQCGRNGVGLVVTVAVCEYFAMVSYRGNEKKIIEYHDGILTEHKPEKIKKEQHGLTTTFKPSSKYLKEEINITMIMVENYFRHMSYIIPDDIKINLYGFSKENYKEGTPDIIRKYTNQGLSANVNYLSSTLQFPPIELLSITDDFDLAVAFSYDKTLDDTLVESYCNYVHTTEGGYHETVTQRAICDFFTREAKKLDANSKYEILFEDCKKGLIFAVNCKHVDPAYEGQHKTKVSNKDVLEFGKRGLTSALYKYFSNNNALLRRIIAYLRIIAKLRADAHKVKGVALKKQTSFLDDAEISGYYPLADRNYNGYTELLIAEGDSAGNALKKCRNSMFQAIYAVMGVVDNVYGLSITQMLTKKVFRQLTTILGCGVGKDFDITKLRFCKIILEADADADGSNITSLVMLYFITFMPKLITEGKIYKALPPLILLNEKYAKRWYKGSMWLFDKKEYYSVINKVISENTEIAIPIDDNDGVTNNVVVPLKKKDAIRFLEMNAEYLDELERLEKRSACNTQILEYACWYKLITATEKDEIKFKELIENKFNELTYDISTHVLEGSLYGESITFIIDSLFWKLSKRFTPILSKNNAPYIFCKNKNNDNDVFEEMSIGDFFKLMTKRYTISIEQRYKGLGEADSEILFITTLNPKTRKLIRFNGNNIKEINDVFELLHAKTNVMREKRRELLDNASISFMDIDN